MKGDLKKNIAIVGHGFVGKATDYGISKNVNKVIIDPKYGNTIIDLKDFNPAFVFVCVPTPMGKHGKQDYSIILKVVNEITNHLPESIVIIKSTVLPDILSKLQKDNKNIVYNPEFLREKNAEEDFINSRMIILGGDINICKSVSNLYLKHSKCITKEYIYTDVKTASLIKYSINTFLSAKVTFFNEIYDLFNEINAEDSWDNFINYISIDERIGSSHLQVPGHDGLRGYGGACFPKDVAALLQFSKLNQIELKTLNASFKKNNKIRSQYKDKLSRELDQNISYDVEL